MKLFCSTLLASLVAATVFGAETNRPSIIPEPQKMEIVKGEFTLGAGTIISADETSGTTGQYLATKLRASTGYVLPIRKMNEKVKGVIWLKTQGAKAELGPEGYELNVGPDRISITAQTQAGLFYGCETLLQLFPPEIFSRHPVENVAWKIPYAVQIEDQPRFKWRGFMLDVSRHFFSKDEVERVLDEMALHKLNMFHWHLTDDQGWRIEIKKYPKLTEVGAWRGQSKFPESRDEADNHEKDNDHPDWAAPAREAFGKDGRYG